MNLVQTANLTETPPKCHLRQKQFPTPNIPSLTTGPLKENKGTLFWLLRCQLIAVSSEQLLA